MSSSNHERVKTRGYRLRILLEDLDDFRRKSCIHVSPHYHKNVRSILYKIWCLFFKDLCSGPGDLAMLLGGYFIPPHETSWILNPDEIVSVRIQTHAVESATLPSGQVNTSTAIMTDSPANMVESVGVMLQRLKGRCDGAEALEMDELTREKQVVEIMETKSLSTDHSTIEEVEGLNVVSDSVLDREALARTKNKLQSIESRLPPDHNAFHEARYESLKDTSRKLNVAYEPPNSLDATMEEHLICDKLSVEACSIPDKNISALESSKRKRADSSCDSESSSDESEIQEKTNTSVSHRSVGPKNSQGCHLSNTSSSNICEHVSTDESDRDSSEDSDSDSFGGVSSKVAAIRSAKSPATKNLPKKATTNASTNERSQSSLGQIGRTSGEKKDSSPIGKNRNVSVNAGKSCEDQNTSVDAGESSQQDAERKQRRRRRRRGVKHRKPAADAPVSTLSQEPVPLAVLDKYVRSHHMSNSAVMARKRSSSVAINPNELNRNSAFVFDEHGNMVPKYPQTRMLHQYYENKERSDRRMVGPESSTPASKTVVDDEIRHSPDSDSVSIADTKDPANEKAKSFGSLSMIPRGLRAPRTRIDVPKRPSSNTAQMQDIPRHPRKSQNESSSILSPVVSMASPSSATVPGNKLFGDGVKRSSGVSERRVSFSESPSQLTSIQTFSITPDGKKVPVLTIDDETHDLCKLATSSVRSPLVFVRDRSAISASTLNKGHSSSPVLCDTYNGSISSSARKSPVSDVPSNSLDVVGENITAPVVATANETIGSSPQISSNGTVSSEEPLLSGSQHVNGRSSRQFSMSSAETVDSISNCNVLNEVGQNRRLEKRMLRALGSQSDVINCSMTAGQTVKDDKYYQQFPVLECPPKSGELIAFKRWDMGDNYSPYVTDFQEARVLECSPTGGAVRLEMLQFVPSVKRRGRFDMAGSDEDEVVDLDSEAGIVELEWRHLLTPRLMYP